MSLLFNTLNTLQLAYIYDRLIVKPKTLKEFNHYNDLIELGLLEYKGFNYLSLTEKGIKYYWENKGKEQT